jgi:hypothetical protein
MAIPAIKPLGTTSGIGSLSSPFSTSTSSKPFVSSSVTRRKKRRQATELQQLQLALAAQMLSDQDKSFVDTLKSAPKSIGKGVVNTTFGALDILSRPGQFFVGGLIGGERARKEGGGFLDQLKEGFNQGVKGFKGEEVNLFSDYLRERGILENHNTLRAIAGFGGDVITDPLTYVAGVGVAVRAGNLLSKAAKPLLGMEDIRKAGKAGENALRESHEQSARVLSEGNLSREDIANDLDKAMFHAFDKADETTNIAGGYVTHNQMALNLQVHAIKSTGAKNIDEAKTILSKSENVTDQKFLSEIEAWTEAAFTGYQRNVNKLAQMTLAIPFAGNLNFTRAIRDGRLILNPTHIGDVRVAPRIPSIERVGAGQGLATAPLVGVFAQGAAKAVGSSLKPGFHRAADHALEMTAKHTRNMHLARIKAMVESILGPSAAALKKRDRDQAIDFYGQEGRVIASQETDEILLQHNPINQAVRRGELSKEQGQFIRDWHRAMEKVRKDDEAWGNKFDWDKSDAQVKVKRDGTKTGGRGYIPHVYTPSGRQLSTIQDRFKSGDAWWSKAKTLKVTPAEIRKMAERGELGKLSLANIETDSMNLLAIRMRASANKRIDTAIEHSIAENMGLPMFLPNVQKVQSLLRETADLTGRQERIVAQLSDENQELIMGDLISGKVAAVSKMMQDKADDTKRRLERNTKEHGHKANANASRAAIRRGHNNQMKKLKERRQRIMDRDPDSPDIKRALKQIARQQKRQQRAFDKMEKRKVQIAKNDLPAAQSDKSKPNKHIRGDYIDIGIVTGDGTRVAIPRELAEMWKRVQTVREGGDAIQGLDKFYNKLMSQWKLLVTSVNIGYRIRNTMTDFWNAFVSGMPITQMAVHGAGAARDMMQGWMHLQKEIGLVDTKRYKIMAKAGLKPDAESRALYDEAMRLGVLSGLFMGDITTLARKFELQERAMSKANPKNLRPKKLGGNEERFRAGSAYSDMMLAMNRNAENWGRFMHYRWRRKTLGQSQSEAARMVRIAHFDYEDLTDFERQVGKRLFPFYTWTRKNIPYQIRQVFQHPGRVATFPKAAREFEHAAEQGDEDKDFSGVALAPKWINDRFGFRVPGGGSGVARFVAPQLGIQDIEKLDDPGGAFKELLSPFIKAPLELATGNSLLTGAPIEGSHPRNPVNLKLFGLNTEPVFSPVAGAIGKLPGIPGPNLGRTERQVGDEQVSGPGINPYWSWLFGQVPPTNYFFNSKASVKEKQRRMDGSAELSYLGGLRFIDVEQQTEVLMRRIKFQDEAKRHIRGLRDEDQLAESEFNPSTFNAQLEAIIRGDG